MADISYTRTTWADGQEGGTAIDATKLNNIEQGIVDAVAAIGPNDTTEDGTLKAQIDQNTSDISDLQDSVSPLVLTGSQSYTADQYGRIVVNVTFSIPSGYRIISVIAADVGDRSAHISGFKINNGNQVNISGAGLSPNASVTATASVVCVQL